MSEATPQQPFAVIFRSIYKRPWVVKHRASEQFVRFCKTSACAERIAAELNATAATNKELP